MLPTVQYLLVERYELLPYGGECIWYWLFMSIVHGAFFVIGILVIAASAFGSRGHFRYRASRWSMFNLFFFFSAGLANALWSYLIFGRLYWSTDYVFDFSPFWPITQSTLDSHFADQVGRLIGISLLQLQALWLVFACSAWALGYALYRWYYTWRSSGAANASNQSLQPTAGRSDV